MQSDIVRSRTTRTVRVVREAAAWARALPLLLVSAATASAQCWNQTTLVEEPTPSLSGGPGFGIPTCGGAIQAGETWNFQYWHRQPMGQPSTFSEAMTVTFRACQ